MPLLEQRRGPYSAVARQSRRLTKFLSKTIPLARNWALTWSILHLSTFVLGGWLANRFEGLLPDQAQNFRNSLVLISALLPAGLRFGNKLFVSVIIWTLVSLLGLTSGYGESRLRNNRIAVYAPQVMAPSIKSTWTCPSLVRVTGWAVVRQKGRWQAPGILVRLKNISSQVLSQQEPQPGQGILIQGKGSPPLPGDLLTVSQVLSIPSGGDLPGMFDYRQFLAGRGIQWRGKIIERFELAGDEKSIGFIKQILAPLRSGIRQNLKTLLPPLEASLASAVLLGVKDETSRDAGEAFSDLGLAHLFAVSGLHVGVLLGLILLPGKILGVSSWQKWLTLILVLPIYAVITGLPGSVIRAVGLTLLATSALPLGRAPNTLHFLGILFWANTIWFPDQVLDIGVRLSYLAAGGILTVSSLTSQISLPKKGAWGFVIGGLIVSVSAQWFTLPLAASSFGRLSLLSAMANLVAVPSFAIAVWLIVLGLATSFIPGGVGASFGALAWLIFRGLSGMINWVDNSTGGMNLGLPVPSLGVMAFWIVGTLMILKLLRQTAKGKLKFRHSALILSLVGILVIFAFTSPGIPGKNKPGPEVWQFDVGQGDASAVRFPDGWTAMIDNAGRFGFGSGKTAGPWSRSISPWLKRQGMQDPNVVVLTHGHLDHTGGSQFMLEESKVGQWLVSGKAGQGFIEEFPNIKIRTPFAGEVLHRWKDWSLVVLYPFANMPKQFHENDLSIVLALEKDGQTQYLWSGDLEKHGEKLLLQMAAAGCKTRIWKAGHHGSNTSGSPSFLDAIDPDLILISCGVGNSYHHPSHDSYIVHGDSLQVVRTDLEGSLNVRFSQSGEIHWKTRLRKGHLPPLP